MVAVRFTSLRLLPIVLLLLMVGCASPYEDRFQEINRPIRVFNDKLDAAVTAPIARGYVAVTPDPVRGSVSNFFSNLGYPLVILNQFLQGKADLGIQDTARFIINSTVGVAGLFDVGTPMGLALHQEDFGQTFGVWGFPMGDYFVFPFVGGYTTRGAVGDALGLFFWAPRYMGEAEHRAAVTALSAINTRASVLGAGALIQGDRYIFLRDGWLQRR